MERISEIMMNLIANDVCGKALYSENLHITDDDLKQLYILSKEHDLAHLVGDALIRHKLLPDGEIKAKFEKQMMTAVYRYERINYELNSLKETLNQAEIPFIPLKGSVLRQYYPEPWMRTSCDIDILVREKDIDAATQTIEKKLGYRYEYKNYHDISFKSESGVHLELHFSLKENEDNIDRLLSDCWQYAAVHKDYEYIFTPEFFLFHQYAHASYHFLNGGCGVRIFLDICILNRFMPLDRTKLDAFLEKCGILKFAQEAEHLANIWFGNAEHTELSRQMERYILCGGVYGTMDNRVAVQQIRRGGKLRYAMSRIWLPYDKLKSHYPSLEGKRVLIPLYEVRRWGKLLFCGGTKRGIRELKLNSSKTKAEQLRTNEMLSHLGLEVNPK
ncbi:MAG: nucleotidyltransferase family protein [Eubacteriales bacterium]